MVLFPTVALLFRSLTFTCTDFSLDKRRYSDLTCSTIRCSNRHKFFVSWMRLIPGLRASLVL